MNGPFHRNCIVLLLTAIFCVFCLGMAVASVATFSEMATGARAALNEVRRSVDSGMPMAAEQGLTDISRIVRETRNLLAATRDADPEQRNAALAVARSAMAAARSAAEQAARSENPELAGKAIETSEAARGILVLLLEMARESGDADLLAGILETFVDFSAALNVAAARARDSRDGELAEQANAAMGGLMGDIETGALLAEGFGRPEALLFSLSALDGVSEGLFHLTETARLIGNADMAQRAADDASRIARILDGIEARSFEAEATGEDPVRVAAQAGIRTRIVEIRARIETVLTAAAAAGAARPEVARGRGVRPGDILDRLPIRDTVPASPK